MPRNQCDTKVMARVENRFSGEPLPKLVEDCDKLLVTGIGVDNLFTQTGAAAVMARFFGEGDDGDSMASQYAGRLDSLHGVQTDEDRKRLVFFIH